MGTKTLKISAGFELCIEEYQSIDNDVYFEYIEHSQDYWNSDSETCVDIDKEKAIEIINFLRLAFDIDK